MCGSVKVLLKISHQYLNGNFYIIIRIIRNVLFKQYLYTSSQIVFDRHERSVGSFFFLLLFCCEFVFLLKCANFLPLSCHIIIEEKKSFTFITFNTK